MAQGMTTQHHLKFEEHNTGRVACKRQAFWFSQYETDTGECGLAVEGVDLSSSEDSQSQVAQSLQTPACTGSGASGHAMHAHQHAGISNTVSSTGDC